MALINFTIELKNLVAALNRLADACDRAYPLPSAKPKLKPIGLEHYSRATDERIIEGQLKAEEEILEHGVNRGTTR